MAQEASLTIFVNGRQLITLLCTPERLNHLVLGHLYFAGIIGCVEDVASINVCPDEPIAYVKLLADDVRVPEPRIISSGCGAQFDPAPQFGSLTPLDSSLRVESSKLVALMAQLTESARLYHAHGGLHISGLADPDRLLIAAEDIGRHNTVDKIAGECLYRGINARDRILITSGRISSELVQKAAIMETPIVASRNSPTERALEMAERLGITLVGYVRGPHLTVFTRHDRIDDIASS